MRRRFTQSLWAWALLVGLASVPAAAAEVYDSATEVRPLLIGSEVPSVSVLALDGSAVNLRDVIGKKKAVVVFYRGGW